VSYPSSYTIS